MILKIKKNSLVILFIILSSCPLYSYSNTIGKEDKLKDLTDLANTKVTSVSKKSEDYFTAPSAIYVITREDIKRSGATSIPEALRLAPGVQVARMGADRWAVATRGNNDTITNKLLVLIDGRSVYSPVFSGVNWDAQDIMLEDIKQIEVIRGPAGTLWGANAVNGVINIITEETVNTLENQVNFAYGNKEKITSARSGGNIDKNSHYRFYAKHSDKDSEKLLNGKDADDHWRTDQGGFRIDWDKTSKDFITLQGDTYVSNIGRTAIMPLIDFPYKQRIIDDNNIKGSNLIARITHNFSRDSSYIFQTYFDHFERNFDISKEVVSTLDGDFQYNTLLGNAHDLTIGTGYRLVKHSQPERFYFNFQPTNRNDDLFSAFVQDKITLIPQTLFLTLGSKFEHNNYTGFEFQPSSRISWLISPNNTIWAAVSRAVRVPNRSEEDVTLITASVPKAGYIALVGTSEMKSEEVLAYELGYRQRFMPNASMDISAFYNDYDNLRTFEPTNPRDNILVPLLVLNMGKAKSHGVEIASTWNVNNKWSLSGSYSYLNISTKLEPTSKDTFLVSEEGKSPKNQFGVRSNVKLSDTVTMDNHLYYVDELKYKENLLRITIPSYYRFDTKLSWQPKDWIELSAVGQNLFTKYHKEFVSIPALRQEEIGRNIYGKVSIKF